MDEHERRRRLRSYGFSATERLNAPPGEPAADTQVDGPADDAPDGVCAAAAGAEEAVADGTHETVARRPIEATAGREAATRVGPSTLARILDSLGFRFGLVILTLGFAVGAATTLAWLPEGSLADAAAAFFVLTLTPTAVTSACLRLRHRSAPVSCWVCTAQRC